MTEFIKPKRSKIKSQPPWWGFDLDGTLAVYDTFVSPTHIGAPIPSMVSLVQSCLMKGRRVKIFTARVADEDPATRLQVIEAIQAWTLEHIGRALEVTCIKDMGMICLYDDRCVQVEKNTGRLIGGE